MNPLLKSAKLAKFSAVLLVAACSAAPALADIVYVTANMSNCVSTTVCTAAPNDQWNPNTIDPDTLGVSYLYNDNGYGAFTSARVTTVPDKPNTPGARYFSNGFSNSTPSGPTFGIRLNPVLGVTGGVYKVFHIFSSTAGNVSSNILLGVTNTAYCTLSFNQTDKFQSKYGQPAPQKWQLLGFLTNDVDNANPIITFYFLGGNVNAGAQQRLLTDTFKFWLYDPCTDTDPVGVTGPLEADLNTVVVTGVTNATAVTVYQDSGSGFVPIGTNTTGLVNGNNTVTVTGLVKGGRVGATQTVNGREGCTPTAGIVVGGGSNPRLRVALSVREAVNAVGPVGANGSAYTTNNARIHYIGASAIVSGQGPADGLVIYPSNNWQTVTLQRGPDYQNPTNPCVIWNSNTSGEAGTQNDLQGDWGTLEAIALALDDESDTGPYRIYIDNITNGGITNTPQIVEDFENAPANMTDYTFRAPSFSGTTSGNILAAPNDAVVDNSVADTGTKSLRVRFQWATLSTNNWLRLNTSNPPGGHRNPLVDLNDPISFRILILPLGAQPPTPPPAPLISARLQGGQVVLNWPGGHRLQATADISGGFTNVPQLIIWPNTNTFVGPWTNTFTEPARLFRLVD